MKVNAKSHDNYFGDFIERRNLVMCDHMKKPMVINLHMELTLCCRLAKTLRVSSDDSLVV